LRDSKLKILDLAENCLPYSVTPVIGEFLSEKLLKSSEILSEPRHQIIRNYQIVFVDRPQD
jgi:hypothetical protein